MQESDAALLLDVAEEAAEISLRFFQSDPEVWEKSDNAGPVTEADLAVNAMFESRLRAARPDYGWLSEGTIFTGYDGVVHGLNIRRDTEWRVIEMFPEPQLAWISRIAVAPDGKQFALVFDEVRR